MEDNKSVFNIGGTGGQSTIRKADSYDDALQTVATRRQGKIFEEDGEDTADISSLLVDEKLQDPATQELLHEALDRFIGLGDASNPEAAFELVLRGMEREEYSRGSTLIRQGDLGSKLYVLDQGEVEVTIDGKLIRHMGRGCVIGELALLYDAPRSATVTNKTNTVLWSLRREIFKQINAVSSSALYTQRSKWLSASPHLACLNAIEMPRLVGTLQLHHIKSFDKLYEEGRNTDRCVLMESGSAFIYTSLDLREVAPGEIDRILGIIRPKTKRTSVKSMNVTELSSYLSQAKMDSIVEDGSDDFADSRNESSRSAGGFSTQLERDDGTISYFACEVYDGCVLGIPALLGKGHLPGGWLWPDARSGAVCPYTVIAQSPVSALVFTPQVFERLFGPVHTVIDIGSLEDSPRNSGSPGRKTVSTHKQRTFSPSSFEMKFVLGSGSFGTVVYAEAAEEDGLVLGYALKIFNKADIIETGQTKHVIDERRLLALMSNRFILRLYGTYQTPHQIVMVTESLGNGDMWSVIYEPPFERVGLPRELVQFYIASLVIALSHIHERGLAYRDLKPENIMLDAKGYIRVIDFGFCKAIPYTKTDASGEVRVFAKSYTLCGTPGDFTSQKTVCSPVERSPYFCARHRISRPRVCL